MKPPATLGERLYELRAQRGLTAKQLSELAGLHEMTVYGWENNRHPPKLLELARVAQVLGVPLPTLLGRRKRTFGEQLQVRRLECGYTQRELGRRMGLQRSRISDWERDLGRPSSQQVRRLEKILGTEFEGQ